MLHSLKGIFERNYKTGKNSFYGVIATIQFLGKNSGRFENYVFGSY